MKLDIHGNLTHDSLLEQYKLFVEMANEISKRRDQTNNFYISLTSAIIALFSLVVVEIGSLYSNFIILLPILGIIICFQWFIHIRSYKQLNSAKFKVINKIEEKLPYQGFNEEWEILNETNFRRLTDIEKYTPIFVGLFYGFLFLIIVFVNYSGLFWKLYLSLTSLIQLSIIPLI